MKTEQTKAYTLVEKLLDQTRLGNLTWQETNRGGVYQTLFTNYSVRIAPYRETQMAVGSVFSDLTRRLSREMGAESDELYILTVVDSDGHTTNRIGPPNPLAISVVDRYNNNSMLGLTLNSLTKLYEIIDRKFSKNTALDEILNELDGTT